MNITYSRLDRFLERIDEIVRLPEIPSPLRTLHSMRIAPVTAAFRAAQDALVRAEAEAKRERGETRGALAEVAQPYAFARSLVRAHLPSVRLPESLTALPTDTDRKLALGELLERLEEVQGEAWADELLAGPYGRLAPEAIREIDEDVASKAKLAAATAARAAAFGPAYEAYLSFKSAVRAGVGASSPAYRRLVFQERPPAAPVEA